MCLSGPAPARAQDLASLPGDLAVRSQGAGWLLVDLRSDVATGLKESLGSPKRMTASFEGGGSEFLHASMIAEEPRPGGQRDSWAAYSYSDGSGITGDAILHAGRYRLNILTNGDAPTSLRVRIPGLAGEAAVQTPHKSSVLISDPLLRKDPQSDSVILGGGIARSTRGFLYLRVNVNYDEPSPLLRGELCAYDSSSASQEPAAYSAGCPKGTTTARFPLDDLNWAERTYYEQAVYDMTPGFDGFGGNFSAQGGPHARFYMAFIPYLPVETSPPPASPIAMTPAPTLLDRRWTVSRTGSIRGSTALLGLRCDGSRACEGLVSIPHNRAVRISIPAGHTKDVRIPLGRELRRRIRRRRELKVDVRIVNAVEGTRTVERHRVSLRSR